LKHLLLLPQVTNHHQRRGCRKGKPHIQRRHHIVAQPPDYQPSRQPHHHELGQGHPEHRLGLMSKTPGGKLDPRTEDKKSQADLQDRIGSFGFRRRR